VSERRTKVTKAQRRYKRAAGKGAFEKMFVAASEIVMRNRGREYRDGGVESILMEFPHWVVFAEDFPKGLIVEKSAVYDVRRIRATKLLDWLYKHGHSPYNTEMLVKQTKHFEYFSKQIERMFDD
jgi:hypothetical protein